jgi:hypothetical protein
MITEYIALIAKDVLERTKRKKKRKTILKGSGMETRHP